MNTGPTGLSINAKMSSVGDQSQPSRQELTTSDIGPSLSSLLVMMSRHTPLAFINIQALQKLLPKTNKQ